MNEEEYLKKKKEIDEEYQQKLHDLRIEYVNKNKQFNIGDFIYNTTGIIKVEEISYEIYNDLITIIYYGYKYKKANGIVSRTKDKNLFFLREDHNVKLLK